MPYETRWVVVVSPRGDVVRLFDHYSEFSDGASLFGLALDGWLEDGTEVAVRGNHVALAWKEPAERWRQHRALQREAVA